MGLLTVSGSPHIKGVDNVKKIMYGVVIAMIPAMLISFYFFGLGAIKVTLVAIASCLLFEFLIQRFLLKGKTTINDGSAIITGILLSFNVPSSMPSWMIIIGSLVAIGIAKMSFGGLGKNPFNPALVGRVFLLISFPVDMTNWPKPQAFSTALTDAITGPTPLAIVKEGISKGQTIPEIMSSGKIPAYVDMLFGNMGGSLGEISTIAILIGGLYLLFRKIITWHIPVSFIGTTFVFALILWLIDPSLYINPLFHLITGGLMLGAVFMATDMVTSPMSKTGQIIFGFGCGVLTILIRVWGAYPEGVSFAILLMNSVTPLINKGFKPTKFGEVVKNG
ncbi:MAG: RnfABCDGE type electron transport complex subunit D [Bacteroidales bacterium]|nr:RnfABCDGE type electron transport complex subunit D [Bacteroidales bacterium]